MDALLTGIGRHRALHAAILAYVAASGLWSLSVGDQAKFLPLMYLPACLALLALVALVRIMAAGLHALRLGNFAARFGAEAGGWAANFVPGALLCLSLTLLHGTYTSVKTIAPDVLPFRYDVVLADIGHAIHGRDAWTLLTWMNPLTDIVQPLYSLVWLLLVVLVTVVVLLSRLPEKLKAHYAWTFTLCWVLLGNVLSSLVLAGGPAYYGHIAGSDRYAGLMAHVATHAGPLSAYDIQTRLWDAYAAHSAGLANGISAFPSMHVSIVTLYTLLGFRIAKPLGFLFLAYAAIILLSSVHLGWHYAIDGYASIVLTIAIWKAVGWALNGFPHPAFPSDRRKRLAGDSA